MLERTDWLSLELTSVTKDEVDGLHKSNGPIQESLDLLMRILGVQSIAMGDDGLTVTEAKLWSGIIIPASTSSR